MKTENKQEEVVIQTLLATNTEFRRLYQKHDELKKLIHDMQKSRFPDQQNLEEMKKKKLALKDRMTRYLRESKEAEPQEDRVSGLHHRFE